MAKYIRYRLAQTVRYGLVQGELVHPLNGEFPDFQASSDPPVALSEVALLTPTVPTKILAIGSNFRDVTEGPNSVSTDEIKFWTKPPNVLLDPEGTIELPVGMTGLKYYHEVELAVVIGKTAKNVKAADAAGHIFGYSCVNDVTGGNFDAGPFPEGTPFFVYGKTFDGFGPFGPSIVTDIDPSDLHLECRVNGKVRQSASTSGLRFGPAQIIEKVTSIMTLYPGDVISMGTPPGVDTMEAGDVVEAEVEHVGILGSIIGTSR